MNLGFYHYSGADVEIKEGATDEGTTDEGTVKGSESWSKESIDRFVKLAGMEKTLNMHILKGRLSDFRQ